MTLSSAVYSGMCASFGSLFGKFSGLEFNAIADVRFLSMIPAFDAAISFLSQVCSHQKLRYTAKILCFCTMVLFNSMVWTFFVKALQNSKTAIEATAISTATNYILSGVLGFIAFGEVTGLLWWFGISLVLSGVVVISGSEKNCKYK